MSGVSTFLKKLKATLSEGGFIKVYLSTVSVAGFPIQEFSYPNR